MDLAIMFEVKKDGEILPLKWNKDNLKADNSIIILDESTLSIYLWHGKQRGLVDRRIALRQADSLKGHGYTSGNTIIGIDIKTIKEIDERKLGKDPETEKMNEDLMEILTRKISHQEGFLVSFEEGVAKPIPIKTRPKIIQEVPQEKVELKEAEKPKVKPESKPVEKEPKKQEVKKQVLPKTTKVKPKEILEKPISYSDSALVNRLDSIELKLEMLIQGFDDLKEIINDAKTPHFITNLKAMKDVIKKNTSSKDAPNYPSRDEMLEKKIKKG